VVAEARLLETFIMVVRADQAAAVAGIQAHLVVVMVAQEFRVKEIQVEMD